MKVLIADDEADVREVVAAIVRLHWAEGEIIEACDGEDAVQRFYDHAPDLVILDVAMPGVSGLQASRAIAAIAPRTRMVLLTNFPSKLLEDYARKVGIKAVLAKDGEATLDRLVSTIEALPDAA